MDLTTIETEAAALVARTVVVVDAETYAAAGAELKRVKAYQERVREHFAPHKKNAHAVHAALCADENRCLELPLAFERATKIAMLTWKQAEDARLAKIAAEAERAAREAAEAAQLEEAVAAEQAGDHAAAAAIVAAPTFTAPVIAPPAAPKVAGIATRKVFKFQVENEQLVPRQFLMVNEVALRKHVNALGLKAQVPGVRVWAEDVMAAGRR